jgi:hypothetical protein
MYTPPRKGMMKILLISDGYFVGRINSLFFPHFTRLIELLEMGQKKFRK